MRPSLHSLGWYHLAGALAGGLVTLWAWSRGAVLPGTSIATAAMPFVLSCAAGVRLLREKASGRRLGYITQLLQIPIVIVPALTWKFIAGVIASITATPKGVGLYAGLEATWLVGNGPTAPFPITLGLNLWPLVILILLVRARPTSATANARLATRPAV